MKVFEDEMNRRRMTSMPELDDFTFRTVATLESLQIYRRALFCRQL